MYKRKIAKTPLDATIAELANQTDKKTLAVWAADCAERTLYLFEEKFPEDKRPRQAIEGTRAWAGGEIRYVVARKLSVAAHAAARDAEAVGESAAVSAARATGHAVATAHSARHAGGAGIYAATAIRNSSAPDEAEANTLREREWQHAHLLRLRAESA